MQNAQTPGGEIPGGLTPGAPQFRYVPDWEKLPEGWSHDKIQGMAVDAQDRVYVLSQTNHPVIVYSPDGECLGSWGDGAFTSPHGITIQGDTMYVVDNKDHTVRALSLDGELRWTLGTPHQPSDTGFRNEDPPDLRTIQRSAGPFNRPTKLGVAPNGDLYVADGYGNARIHRFSPALELLDSWGEPGEGPGQFIAPHSVKVHADGRVFVCDRENDRVQIFSSNGELLEIWPGLARPSDMCLGADGLVYLAEMGWRENDVSLAGQHHPVAQEACLTVRDLEGNILVRLAASDPGWPKALTSPHSITVDSRGNFYAAELLGSSFGPARAHKFARVPEHHVRTHHVAYSVADFDASVSWWQQMLGFAVDWVDDTPGGGKAAFLLRNGEGIELFWAPGARPLQEERREFDTHREAHGMIHVCIEVDDVEGLVTDLRAKGVEIARELDTHPLARIGFIRDNSGNLIELYEPREGTPEALGFRETHRPS
jgi:catechol 2,3-dioxygenase-like lactoylglutathione lyase family enzyme/sugar lactone lactonase YvrE